jgi:CSLREA domain-containing protein
MKHRFLNFWLVIPLLLALAFGAAGIMPAYAAGAILVNNASDDIADDGACTLREAITNANGDSQLYASAGECATGSGDDTITFASNYTITVGSELPEVTSANGAVTITGNGSANTVIQASTCNPITLIDSVTSGSCTAATYRVFRVAGGATATLEALTVRYGGSPAGGAIITSGSLTLNEVVVRDSQAPTLNGGAIVASNGELNLNHSLTMSD